MIRLHFGHNQTAAVAIESTADGRLLITDGGSIRFHLSGDLATELFTVIRDLQGGPGIIHASPPNQPARHWTTPQITIDDLAGLSLEQALPLLIRRFQDSPADIYTALLDDYKRLTGKTYRSPKEESTQDDQQRPENNHHPDFAQNFAMLLPDLITLLDEQGQAPRGLQTEIARRLNFPQTGGVYYPQIVELIEALQAEFKERKSA